MYPSTTGREADLMVDNAICEFGMIRDDLREFEGPLAGHMMEATSLRCDSSCPVTSIGVHTEYRISAKRKFADSTADKPHSILLFGEETRKAMMGSRWRNALVLSWSLPADDTVAALRNETASQQNWQSRISQLKIGGSSTHQRGARAGRHAFPSTAALQIAKLPRWKM